MLKEAYRTVKQFNFLAKRSTNHSPIFPSPILKRELVRRIKEEVNELEDARTMKDIVDAMIDILYITLDAFVILGLNPSPFFRIVAKKNLEKVWPDGWMRVDENGKVVKPVGWIPPDAEIEKELRQQGAL